VESVSSLHRPEDAAERKEALQVYVVIVAGVVAAITAAVGLLNLRLTRRNLEQQRELEAQRAEQQRELEAQRAEQQRVLAQGTALQAYYEQIGELITEYDLLNTERKEIRELARGQTLTVLQEVDGKGKGSLLTFLYGAGLIGAENPAVTLIGANLQGAHLQAAILRRANLQITDLRGAHLQGARGVTVQQLARARLDDLTTMPDGQKYEEWLKDKKAQGNDEKNE